MAITGHDSYQDALEAAIDGVCADRSALGIGEGGLLERSRVGTDFLDRKLAGKRLRYDGFTMGAV
jgi:hypothetical protein